MTYVVGCRTDFPLHQWEVIVRSLLLLNWKYWHLCNTHTREGLLNIWGVTHMDTEPQEIRNMFNCMALSSGLDQHTLFEWEGMCVRSTHAWNWFNKLVLGWDEFKLLPVQSIYYIGFFLVRIVINQSVNWKWLIIKNSILFCRINTVSIWTP